MSLDDLPRLIRELPEPARNRVERLFEVRVAVGETEPPATMHAWLEEQFGSVEAIRRQRVVKVTNRVTLQQTLFSALRARRPVQDARGNDLAEAIEATSDDPFCSPTEQTPAESWGRIRGSRTLSGANAAKYDAHHAVIVFDAHDPLAFDAETIGDLFATGRKWAERVRALEPEATYYFLMWNCLWRAGGSIVHGHAQATLASGRHYGRVERFRRDALAYRAEHGTRLLDDLVEAHADLGLTITCPGGSVFAHLTPLLAREVLIVGKPGGDERDPPFVEAVSRVLTAYRDALGVRSFNMALWRGPLAGATEDWREVQPIVHLVDRGDPDRRPSDIGAMELYAASVVGTDPFEVAEALRSAL